MFKAVFKVGVPRFSEAGQYCFDLTGGSGNYSLELFSGAEDFYSLEAFTRSQTCEVQELIADVLNANDYYPFGMQMPGRSFNGGDYRYGFNGMEKDDELKGEGSSLDFGARIYDPRVARFLSIDPLTNSYPWQTPYVFAADNPVLFVDSEGKNNVIYIVLLPSAKADISKEEQEEIVANLNQSLAAMGLKTQAIIFEQDKDGQFDPTYLDANDTYVMIGSNEELISASKSGKVDCSTPKKLDSKLSWKTRLKFG